MIKGYRYLLIVFLALGFLISSCEEENLNLDPVVISEQVLFVSGEQVRLAGRLVATEKQPISDHGFIISTEESFTPPITISLGERSTPGRFIGETSGLVPGQSYFWKPFTIIDGKVIEGITSQFSTLSPELLSFSPITGFTGANIIIIGRNFTSDARVFFDDREAVVLGIDQESIIRTKAPEIGSTRFSNLSVVFNEEDLVAEQKFEYVIGKWELVDNFITSSDYSLNISFIDNDKFYFGLGYEDNIANPLIWILDIPTWQWADTDYDGDILISSFNGSPFFGSGRFDSGLFSDDFFVLEGGNFIEKNSLPFQLTKSVAFKIGENIYVLGGNSGRSESNFDVYKYINVEDKWEYLTTLPINISADYPHFVHGSMAYFILPDQRVYRFDPSTPKLEKISEFPSKSIEQGNGVYQVIGDKAYIGLFSRDRSMWEYDIPINSWKPKLGLSGGLFDDTPASFTYDGVIYAFKNPTPGSTEGMSIWSFKPEEF